MHGGYKSVQGGMTVGRHERFLPESPSDENMHSLGGKFALLAIGLLSGTSVWFSPKKFQTVTGRFFVEVQLNAWLQSLLITEK